MKIIESIIEKETISINRIKGYIPSTAGTNYNFTASIIPNNYNYSACTAFNEPNPTYEIHFPYDTFYAEKLNYTIKTTRYPKSLKIQGFNEKNQLIDIISNLEEQFCLSNYENNCIQYTSTIIEIPVQLYKGFKISMIGKDSMDSTQLCVGQFEIEGIIVRLPSKIEICFKFMNYIYTLFLICSID